MEIGKAIRKRRRELNMSADDLAKRLGKDRSTVYRYENGDIGAIPIDLIIPLAHALETTPQALIGWREDSPAYHVDFGLDDKFKGSLFISDERVAGQYDKWYRLTGRRVWEDREFDLLLECGKYIMQYAGTEMQEERLQFLSYLFRQFNEGR